MDITTPITTVPTANNPTTTTPMLNPTDSNSDQSSPTIMNPANPQMTTPLATNMPTPTSGSWCAASSSAVASCSRKLHCSLRWTMPVAMVVPTARPSSKAGAATAPPHSGPTPRTPSTDIIRGIQSLLAAILVELLLPQALILVMIHANINLLAQVHHLC